VSLIGKALEANRVTGDHFSLFTGRTILASFWEESKWVPMAVREEQYHART